MFELHPALVVLLLLGLLIFWFTPISAWWMLSRPVDLNARIWFIGTAIYALAATLFVFSNALPTIVTGPVTMSLAMTSVLCIFESVRREQSDRPAPLGRYAGFLGLHLATVIFFYHQHRITTLGMMIHLTLISALEMALIRKVLNLQRRTGSRALWLVIFVLTAFVLVNVARALSIGLSSEPSTLLDFTWLSSIALIINYLSVIFYCYGYWGYALEKNKLETLLASEQAMTAKHGELIALEREQLSVRLLEQRTHMMEQLAKVGKLAQSGALSATIAHEINQPLAAIRLNVEEALRRVQGLQADPVLTQLIGRIDHDNLRAAQIVSRVKSIFTASTGNYQLSTLDPVIQTVLELLEARIKEANIIVKTRLTADQPINMSEHEMQHALLNLIENAIESLTHIPATHRQIDIDTWIEGGSVRLSVLDNGPGIATDMRCGIFDLLASTKSEGMGIGLWLTRFISERHGGSIDLDETIYPGARFVIAMPIGH